MPPPFRTVRRPPPVSSFTLFPKLPPEVRVSIWSTRLRADSAESLINIIVPVLWDTRQRTFYSPRKPPVLLHTCQESRHEALKWYRLSFASSPEFARIYFNFEHDILLLNWFSLGSSPGRLGRKIMDEECAKVQTMMIAEGALMSHAEEQMKELERFTGLKSLAVICEEDNPQCGEEFGAVGVEQLGKELDADLDADLKGHFEGGPSSREIKRRDKLWPELVCLRDDDDQPPCSRHWFFAGWNERATVLQKSKWPGMLSRALMLTREDAEDETMFLMNLLFAHAAGQIHP